VKSAARDIIIYALLQSIFSSALAALGEDRPDAYVSVSILIYFVSTTVLPSFRKYSDLRILDAVLIAVFSAIAAVRVLEILGYMLRVVFP